MPTDSYGARLEPFGTYEGEGVIRLCLDLEVGGAIYRFTDGPAFEVEHLGETLVYEEGLEADVDLAMGDESEASVPVTLIAGIDWAELVESGHLTSGNRATLLRWREGTAFSRRQIVLVGEIDAPTFGEQGEPLAFSVNAIPLTDTATFPPPGWVVDSESWPNFHESVEGRVYPFVFGTPGYHPDHRIAATPALLVDTTWNAWRYLIAGHEVRATRVWWRDKAESTSVWRLADVEHIADGRGHVCATFLAPSTVGASDWLDPNLEHDVVICWSPCPGAALRVVTQGGYLDGETFTLTDHNGTAWVFEFNVSGAHVVGAGNIEIDISADTEPDDAKQVCDRIIAAINEHSPFRARFSFTTTTQADPPPSAPNAVMHILNPHPGSAGNVGITDTVATAFFGPAFNADMDGGADEDERGGIQSPHRGQRAAEGAGELLSLLLGYSSLPVDAAAVAAVAPRLDRLVKVAGYIEEPVVPLEWLRAHLLGELAPVTLTMGPDGVRPLLWEPPASLDAIGTVLDADELDIERLGPVEFTGTGEIINKCSIEYSFSIADDTYRSKYTAGGATDENPSATRHRSRVRFGERSESLQSDILYDPRSAAYACHWRTAEKSRPRMRAAYEVNADLVCHLLPGDPVLVTDSAMHWTERPWFVVSIRDAGGPTVELLLESIDPDRLGAV